MADVKWIKIVTDIFDDEKILLIEQMPDADTLTVIWFKLLTLARKQNNRGVFMIRDSMPYTDEMFASVFRRPLNTIRLALSTFEKFRMVSIINNTVTIPIWSKHQNIEGMEKRQDYMRQYMKAYREEQKLLADGKHLRKRLREHTRKQNVSKTDIDTDKKPPISPKGGTARREKIKPEDSRFTRFWSEYTKKVSKSSALKAFARIGPDEGLLRLGGYTSPMSSGVNGTGVATVFVVRIR